ITVTAMGTGPWDYEWLSGGNQIANNTGINGANTLSNLPAGTYIINIIDVFDSCRTADTVVITEPPALNLSTSVNNPACADSAMITVTASGGTPGYNFAWNTIPIQTTPSITVGTSGTYICGVIDQNGCADSVVVNISILPTPQVTIRSQNISCAGADDGWAVADVTGGAGTLTYAWTTIPVSNADSIFNLAPGPYQVIVTDSLGCADTANVTISAPSPLALTFDLVQDVSCNGASDGCIAFTVTGGHGNFAYNWSNGGTTDSICGLPAGTYVITVTDTFYTSQSGQVIWSEDFDGVTNWTLNVPTGVNGVDNNFWVINDNEGGVAPPNCGVANNGDATLHITSVFNPLGGAAYDAGGLCGVLFCPQTNMRAESPTISTVGFSNLFLDFEFISNGDALLDNASVWMNPGTGWVQLNPSIKSPVCLNGQGQWSNAVSIALPATANNNPNLQIGFNWTNNDDGVGSDPSVAINDITISTQPPAGSFVVCTLVDSATI
ncbi:MAG: SprB repeat-containing protein, partial [Bacteroidota bacterium]